MFTREEIAAEVWGQLELGDTRTVDVHVSRLRMKLGPDVRGYVKTVGYGMFIPHGGS
jgi:DNA-binding response OmpR family regulator